MKIPPRWLADLANAVAAEIAPVDVLPPLGCHFCKIDDVWEISLFPGQTETIGGLRDGRLNSSPFSLDVSRVMQVFDKVLACHWQNQPISSRDELGAHLALEGVYSGKRVCLRVLAVAPARFETARQIRVHDRSIVEMW